MNHTEAEESQAVERYTLEEMRQEEREAFEEHYFDCRVCSQGVRDSARMMAAGRRVASETAVPATNVVRMPSRWKAWIPAAAAAMLLMVNGGLLFVQRSGPAPVGPSLGVAHEHNIAAGPPRSGEERIVIERTDAVLAIDIEPPEAPEQAFSSYEILIRSSDGKTKLSQVVSAEQAKSTVRTLPRSLPAGSYDLVIEGIGDGNRRSRITTRKLTVQ
jgi:hypothetical protein